MFILACVTLLTIIYFGYRSHSTDQLTELPSEKYREEIRKDKQLWQEKKYAV